MPRPSLSVRSLVLLLLITASVESRAAVPQSETLLPSSTKGFLSIGSLDQLKQSWNKTQLGQLAQDPAMKPFVEDLKRQLQEKWAKTHEKLGITWEDLETVPSGETCLAMILPSATEVATVVMADTTGKAQPATALLDKINKNMVSRNAMRAQRDVFGTRITVYNVPKRGENEAYQVCYFLQDDLLVMTDHLKVIEGIASRKAESRSDSLSHLPAFESIMKRCKAGAGDLVPHARWFIEPFGYADAGRLMRNTPRTKGTDMLKILRDEGFTAVQGLGGFVNFSAANYEMLHRTFIFAPGNANGPRFELAARMLDMPNGGDFTAPDFVPRDIATYVALNVNVKNAFEMSKSLVNAIVGDEVFEDVLDSIKTDENGPKIDVRKDVIALLGDRIMMISDLHVPITPKSERVMFAVPTTDEKKLSDTIKRWMEADPDTRRREIGGHVVWEIVDEKAELPMVTIERAPDQDNPGGEEEPAEDEKPLLPNSAVTVAYGHLLVATHIDILAKVLSDEQQRGKLVDSSDYKTVRAELAKLGEKEQFGQAFTRTDDAYRGTYEMLRTGKMPESESMIGKILNGLLGDGKEGSVRSSQIDGSKLPDYDMVRRYLGPAGMSMTTEGEGWFLIGFTLNKAEQ